MISQYQPMGDRIIVKEKAREETTSFGLILSPTVTDDAKTFEATVISVGPKVEDVKSGDVVIIPKGTGVASSDEGGDKIIIVPLDVVLGVYE